MSTIRTISIPTGDDAFERVVLSRLNALGRRRRMVVLGSGASVVITLMVASALLDLGADWFLRFGAPMRAIFLAAALGLLGTAVYRRVVRPAVAPLRADEMALLIERRHPDFNDALISAVQLDPGTHASRYSSALIHRLRDRVCRVSSGIPFEEAVQTDGLRNRALLAGLALFLLAATAFITPSGTMRTWFLRNVTLADVDWPKRTRLILKDVESGRILHPRGDDFQVGARLADGSARPRRVVLQYRELSGTRGSRPMTSIGSDGYRCVFPRLLEPLQFRLSGGDEETPWISVELVDRPRVERIELTIDPPEYTGGEATRLRTNQTTARILAGSRVRIELQTNVSVETGSLINDEIELAPVLWTEDRMGHCELVPTGDVTGFFRLIDANGLENDRPVRISIRVTRDKPPTVRLSIDGVSGSITPQARLPIRVHSTDEYGLAQATLHIEGPNPESAPQVQAFPELEPGVREYDGLIEWQVGADDPAPGDRFSLQARATDLDDVNGPNEGQSFLTRLNVVTAEELLAEIGRREQEYRMEFERILQSQEDLRTAVLTELKDRRDADQTSSGRRALAEQVRTQRILSNRVGGIAERFDQILKELRVNALSGSAVEQRLSDGIIDPLNAMAQVQMAGVQELMLVPQPQGDELDRRMQAIIDEMRRVLDRMIEWEGFQEAVVLLRNLIDEQEKLNRLTDAELDRRVRDLLGDE